MPKPSMRANGAAFDRGAASLGHTVPHERRAPRRASSRADDDRHRRVAIVGIAKSAFEGGVAIPVLRGESRQPLCVTAIGADPSRAAELVRDMHDAHRIPTLLERADQLARGHEHPAPSKTLPDDDTTPR